MFSAFMINTWLVATIVALVAGVVGFFVVIRGFRSQLTPSLGTFPGAVAAHLLGISPLIRLCLLRDRGDQDRPARPSGTSQGGNRSLPCDAPRIEGALPEHDQSVFPRCVFPSVWRSARHQHARHRAGCGQERYLDCTRGAAVPAAPVVFDGAELGEARGVSSRRMELWFLTIFALTTTMTLPGMGLECGTVPAGQRASSTSRACERVRFITLLPRLPGRGS